MSAATTIDWNLKASKSRDSASVSFELKDFERRMVLYLTEAQARQFFEELRAELDWLEAA